MSNDESISGIIKPPPQLREYVDKTASFVAQNGKEFEDRIRKMGQAKFGFLEVENPYHKYYMSKVDEFALELHKKSKQQTEEGSPEDKSEESPVNQVQEEEKPQIVESSDVVIEKAPVQSVIGQAARTTKQSHPGFDYCIPDPEKDPVSTETRERMDILRLTAKYAAVLGKGFVTEIANKELHNPEFAFLKPTSPLFEYFKFTVEQYRGMIDWDEFISSVSNRFQNKMSILDRSVQYSEEKRKRELEEAEKQVDSKEAAVAFHEIDWHDFVLLDTLTFDDMNKFGRSQSKIEEDANYSSEEMELENEDEGDKIVVKKNFKSRVDTKTVQETFVTLPDGRKVRADELNEHMRVEMLDPKWREQKERFLEKQRVVAFVDKDISKNLSSMASHRPDVFGQDKETTERLLNEENEKKKARMNAVTWDGTSDSVRRVIEASKQRQQEPIAPPAPSVNSSSSATPQSVTIDAKTEAVKRPAEPLENANTVTKTRKMALGHILSIDMPSEPSAADWNLNGQRVTIQLEDSMTTVSDIKVRVVRELTGSDEAIPLNKFQLKTEFKFLKDTDTVEEMISSLSQEKEFILQLRLRKRGGRN